MMKKGLCAVFSIFFLVPQSQAYTGFGICNFGKETVPTVVCYGPTVLKDTTVSGDMKVAGPLTAENISAISVTVTGSADITNSTIKGPVTVTGSLNADNVTFQQDLTLNAEQVHFNHVKIKGSVLISSGDKTPYLVMECGTSIKGTLTFQGKAGVIQITDDSIAQGKVTNGAMIFIKKKC